MKHLGMSLEEIKSTPRYELEGLMYGLSIYDTIHEYDGYSPKDIGQMAKDKPEIRQQFVDSKRLKDSFEIKAGRMKSKKISTFTELM